MRGTVGYAVILGSGLSGVAGHADAREAIPYRLLPGMRAPSVPGHPGFVALRGIADEEVLLFAGRSHVYEGASAAEIAAPVALAASAGCRRLLVTHAAGSLTGRLRPGTWMLATALVSFPSRVMGGFHAPGFPLERPDAAELVSRPLGAEILRAARKARIPLEEGTLCWTSGPTYETAAEAEAASRLGADAVTMSSLPELLAARRLGLEAACLGWITNDTARVARVPVGHGDVIAMGDTGARSLDALLAALFAAGRGA